MIIIIAVAVLLLFLFITLPRTISHHGEPFVKNSLQSRAEQLEFVFSLYFQLEVNIDSITDAIVAAKMNIGYNVSGCSNYLLELSVL